MSLASLIKTIAKGERGANDLSRAQACELMHAVLSEQAHPAAVGAMCVAMRFKGESVDELLGFLDALDGFTTPLNPVPSGRMQVVIPSYNGARKLPMLTPLLAAWLAREGLDVWVHGTKTSSDNSNEGVARTPSQRIWQALADADGRWAVPNHHPQAGQWQAAWMDTATWSPALVKLLALRQTLGLRNSAHSLVKLACPVQGPAVLVTSYTHPSYHTTMGATLSARGQTALLLRSTEGEAVADLRRMPNMDATGPEGLSHRQDAQTGSLPPDTTWSHVGAHDIAATVALTLDVLDGRRPLPQPMATQVAWVKHLATTFAKPTP